MRGNDGKGRRPAVALGEAVARVIGPLTARRGFARAELVAAWPAIAGPLFAGCTLPERIVWPRHAGGEAEPGILFLRVDGPRAVLVQHEIPQIVERVNAFLGYAAIGGVRIVQGPVRSAESPPAAPTELPAEASLALAETLRPVADEGLRAALDRLGRGVFARPQTLHGAPKRHI
jgi:hypothetical protein